MTQQRIGIRRDILELITSEEAYKVTPLMTTIYCRLLVAPPERWESSEALRVKGSMREEVWTAAWVELVNLLRVAAWDARNAIERLQEKKVIDKSLHMMRKGQVKRLDGRDAVGQARFVESLFGVAA